MAVHEKTIKYAFPMRITTLSAATRLDFSAETLNIDETVGRVFKSVRVDVWARGNDATAVSLTSWLIGVKLGAVAFDDVTVTDTIANTGEHTEWMFSRDLTAYFTANFGTGASQTCQIGLAFGAVSTIDIVAELTITYEYDGASASTRTKTVEFPLDSNLALLTGSLVEMGTNQIPQLTGGGALPESGITIRDWYIKVIGNEKVVGAAADISLGLQIDSDTEYVEGLRESQLGSSCSFVTIYSRKASVPTTTAVHALKARSTTTQRFHFAVILVVTYSYDHANSTQILNSIRVPMTSALNDLIPHASASGDKHTLAKDVWIEEPGTITMKQSGIVLYVSPGTYGSTCNLVVQAGAGSARTYSIVRTSDVPCGSGDFLSQRIDSGGAGGAAITLARGKNAFEVDLYHDAGAVGNESPTLGHAVLYLNYVSDKHAEGDGVHNHTVEHVIVATAADANSLDASMAALDPPESSYFINSIGIVTDYLSGASSGRSPWAGEFDSGEGPGTGWQPMQGAMMPGSNELGWVRTTPDVSPVFRLWPGDPRAERMNPETSRLFRWAVVAGGATSYWVAAHFMATYHSIKWTKSFELKDYPSGDGSNMAVSLHRNDTKEPVLLGTTSAGGVVSFTWYDDTIPCFIQGAHGTEPSDYRGRSAAVLMSAAAS